MFRVISILRIIAPVPRLSAQSGIVAAIVVSAIANIAHADSEWTPGLPPVGYVEYCKISGDCPTSTPHPAKMNSKSVPTFNPTRAQKTAIAAINRRVNRTLRYDHPRGGWRFDTTIGDCRTYVAIKRRALIQSGIPRRMLRTALVLTPRDEVHAVLLLDTRRGLRVLDSLTDKLAAPAETGYRWMLVEQPTGIWLFHNTPAITRQLLRIVLDSRDHRYAEKQPSKPSSRNPT